MKLTVFNASPRGKGGNSEIILEHFLDGFEATPGNSHELFYVRRRKQTEQFVQAFAEAEHVLLATPLYTDCMPGLVKGFIEALEPLCGREGNPDIAFIVQSGFGEAAHSRYLEEYFQKLAVRLGSRYIGTIIKGNCEGLRTYQKMYGKVLETFRELGAGYGATGEFDTPMLQKFAGPEKLPAAMRLLIQLMNRLGAGTAIWDKPLKENGAYEQRFARPYAE